MGPREDVSCATHNKTDQEKLAAVRQRVQQDTPRVSSAHTHCTITVTCGSVSTLCVTVIATLMCMTGSPLFALQRVQTLSIDESLKLQLEQHRREEVSVCVCVCMCVCTCMCMYMFVCLGVFFVYVFVCVCVFACVRVLVCLYLLRFCI